MGDQEEISTDGIDPEALESARVLQAVAKEITNNEDQSKQLKLIVETIAYESLKEERDYLVLTEKTREFVDSLGFTDPFSVSKTKDVINILLLMWNHTNVTRYVLKSVYNVNIASTADEMIDQFPSDLKQLDAQSAEIFAKALKDGSESVKNIRLMVVGMFGVGKTSLVNNLIKDLRDENVIPVSTEGIDLRRCQLMKNGDWRLDKEHKSAKYKERYITAFKEALESKEIDVPLTTPNTIDVPEEKEIEVDNVITEEKLVPLETISRHVEKHKDDAGIKEYLPLVHDIQDFNGDENVQPPVPVEQKTNTTVSVWDFAGQTLYYSTHQFFLNKRSIYLVLMDMTKGLNENVKEEELSGTWCGLNQECTYLDVFKFWLNAIHMYSGYKSMSSEINPTVILVGTRKDEMKGTDDDKEIQKDKYFELALRPFERSSIVQHIHYKKFLANNLSPKDSVFDEIRKEIKCLAKGQDYWGEIYPVRWIQMEQSIDRLRDSGEQVINMEAINEANQSHMCPLYEKELSLFLKIQHRHGNILYFDTEHLKHLVVLAPQWIIEVFKCFITHKRNKNPKLSEYWRTYEDLAILKPEVFNEIMDSSPKDVNKNRDHILEYMEYLDVMAKPLKFEDAEGTNEQSDAAGYLNPTFLEFHIVPCRLKNPPPPIAQFTAPEHREKTPVLCFVFVDNFMPPSFFHRLVAVCIRTWCISKENGQYLLFNGLAVFEMGKTSFLTIWYKDHIIYARISSCSKECTLELEFKLCEEVRIKLRESLHNFVGQTLEKPRTPTGFEEYIQCPKIKKDSLYNVGLFRLADFMYNRELTCKDCLKCHAVGREEVMSYWYKEQLDRLDNDDGLNEPAEESDLLRVAKFIDKEFWLLGIQLDLKDAEMNKLYEDCDGRKDRRTFVFRYMVMWKKKEGKKATRQRLNRAIHAARLNFSNDEITPVTFDSKKT
ncbi:uncharacterized protein LOC127866715 [Dreissena polymorpha]|uniref:non-specific serine/threonine protein kinase n=1 Tax=Dreissena polymorpha TaxID=45954 RepID=A0A9D4RF49_DREPO|nr:uncharacterized protein LOC127866715 [Dreissena polymorpha]XP_052263423.1 uncharacterized protein LOC127866715 [Dreissena polymorpha]KAH3864015.1 hypothetical protein DPMN_027027 [Dreissena polymorpha]